MRHDPLSTASSAKTEGETVSSLRKLPWNQAMISICLGQGDQDGRYGHAHDIGQCIHHDQTNPPTLVGGSLVPLAPH